MGVNTFMGVRIRIACERLARGVDKPKEFSLERAQQWRGRLGERRSAATSAHTASTHATTIATTDATAHVQKLQGLHLL